jgi:excisionase family DNA binding protein
MDTSFLTLKETARYLRISEITAYRLAEKKDLPGRKHGRKWMFLKSELDEWSRWSKR